MIYYKEECKQLVATKATVLLLDTHTENGTPVFVIRRIVGMGGLKSGRDSRWYVNFDREISNGCTGACPGFILGINTGDTLDITPLVNEVNRKYSYLPVQERLMLISDARFRLKEAKL